MEEFIQYLEQKIAAGKAEIAALEAEGRKDDANVAKVRTNIDDVCKTVSQALLRRPDAGVGAIRAQFDRFQTIWGAALDKAKEHHDVAGIAVEETKLAALQDVAEHFREATGA